jgi:hypothetical protein
MKQNRTWLVGGGGIGLCVLACCAVGVINGIGEALRPPAEKTATAVVRLSTSTAIAGQAQERTGNANATATVRAGFTATPTPVRPFAAVTGQFVPRNLRVGQRLEFRFSLTNNGAEPINVVRISASGPFDKYTVIGCVPVCAFDKAGFISNNFFTVDTGIAVGETKQITVAASPNEPGNHDFSFRFYQGREGANAIRDEKGEPVSLGGAVAVTR